MHIARTHTGTGGRTTDIGLYSDTALFLTALLTLFFA
jgi:hypothetical protein